MQHIIILNNTENRVISMQQTQSFISSYKCIYIAIFIVLNGLMYCCNVIDHYFCHQRGRRPLP